jgi:methionine-rich copper-binding protein CopC
MLHSNVFVWRLVAALLVVLAATSGTAFAHVRPQTTDPGSGARLDAPPAHLVLNYDGDITQSGSSVIVLDSAGNPVPTNNDPVPNNRMASVSPAVELAPGPYTVVWTTVDATDGHTAQGFYTVVVNGGPVGIIAGQAESQAPAADLLATFSVAAAADGGSLLRVDLNNSSGVERVRIRLSRPDLGEVLLDTRPSGDGGWVLSADEVAVPGAWHAVAIVRRANIFDDAQAAFDFSVDPVTGMPAFGGSASLTEPSP